MAAISLSISTTRTTILSRIGSNEAVRPYSIFCPTLTDSNQRDCRTRRSKNRKDQSPILELAGPLPVSIWARHGAAQIQGGGNNPPWAKQKEFCDQTAANKHVNQI